MKEGITTNIENKQAVYIAAKLSAINIILETMRRTVGEMHREKIVEVRTRMLNKQLEYFADEIDRIVLDKEKKDLLKEYSPHRVQESTGHYSHFSDASPVSEFTSESLKIRGIRITMRKDLFQAEKIIIEAIEKIDCALKDIFDQEREK